MVRRVAQYLGLVRDEPGVGRAVGAPPAHGSEHDLVVIVVFVPAGEPADAVRAAAAEAGAGAVGDYRSCSFSAPGEGRFEPQQGARPAIGSVGVPEVVEEHRIEVVCPRWLAGRALRAMLAAHPYEEPAHHVYPTIRSADL